MDISEVHELMAYNAWANRRLFDGLGAVPADEYGRDLKTSHGGIGGTVAHIVWGEQLWLTRWQGAPPPAVPQGRDLPTLAAARERWDHVEAARAAWLAAFPPARLTETIAVHPTTGGEFHHTFAQMFRHFVNHSSYHRGQVVTMLRQLGHTPPNTDLILYYRR
jgi:uncharacterized damage-inducible protein DinB